MRSFVRKLNWVTEKSAAREACFPSFPTIPMPILELLVDVNEDVALLYPELYKELTKVSASLSW